MCSENEGADQLHGYREAGLRLKFCLSIFFAFLCSGSYTFTRNLFLLFSLTALKTSESFTLKPLLDIVTWFPLECLKIRKPMILYHPPNRCQTGYKTFFMLNSA